MHTEHFKDKHAGGFDQLACPCCGQGTIALATLMILEDVREHFGKPVQVTCGCRCKKYNAKIPLADGTFTKGAKNSSHLITDDDMEAEAVDFVVTDVTPTQVRLYLKSRPYANNIGIGKYKSFVHVDTRGYAARW